MQHARNTARLRELGTTISSIPLVAQAIARAHKVKVSFGGHPRTDGTVIYLPTPESLAAKFGEDTHGTRLVLWGFLDHESAHIRFTDFKACRAIAEDRELQQLVNIVEDIRIEQAMGATFPGASVNLRLLVEHLTEQGWFAAANPSMSLVDRGACYILHWLRSRVLFQPALAPLADLDAQVLPPSTVTALEPLLRWSGINSTNDAIVRAKAILDVLREEAIKEQAEAQEQSDQASDSTLDEGQGGEKERDAEPSPQEDDAAGSTSTGSDPSPSGHSEPGTPGAGPARIDQVLANGGDLGNLLGAMLKEDTGGTAGPVVPIPCEQADDVTTAPGGSPRTLDDPTRMRRIAAQLSVHLQEGLQAKTHAKARLGMRGTALDTRVLHRVGLGDGRLFRSRTIEKRPDTAIAVALDLSGSMQNCWEEAVTSALSSLAATQSIRGVTMGLYLFPHHKWAVRMGQKPAPSVRAGQLLEASGGTPTHDALTTCAGALIDRPEPRKIVICVTDGDPNRPVDDEISMLRDLGINTLGIGIQTSKNLAFDSWISIHSANELKTTLARTLARIAIH